MSDTINHNAASLAKLTTAQIAVIYNDVAPVAEQVKRFATKQAGIDRTLKLLNARKLEAKTAVKKDKVARGKNQLVQVPAPALKATKKGGQVKVSQTKAPGVATVAGTIKQLIVANPNMTNKDIWNIVQPQFKLPDSKRGYPGWYRAEMNRKAAKKGA